MKLQVALDMLDKDKAIWLMSNIEDYVDIIEIGTPLLKYCGIDIVKKMKELFPYKTILVDMKTMDVGKYEADFAFDNGADIVTVLGVADIETIKGSIESAKEHNKKVVVDMINVKDKLRRSQEVESLNVDYIGIHSGIDQQKKGMMPFYDLVLLSENIDIPLSIAGGIDLDNINGILSYKPEIVVVGGAITNSVDPKYISRELKRKIDENS